VEVIMAAHDRRGSGCDEECPVLIIGGGLAGLSAAVFLGLRGVRAVVAERHSSTSIHPRARGQVPTTMEALRTAGVGQRMREASPDGKLSVVIAESLAGREIVAHIADEYPDFSRYSDAGWAMASQQSAERILAGRAAELGADLRFGTEAEAIRQDAGGVTVTLRDRASGAVRTVRAGYLVVADGHRGRCRDQLGIGVHGRGVLATAMSIVFEADLAGPLRGRRVVLYHMRGSLPGATFVTTDDPRRHNVHVGIGEGDWDEQRCADAVRIVTGIPDLPVRILSYAPWDTAAWVADRFAQGRVFLVGDAARVMPPTGGMGGNSAILDGFSLAWKLAMVISGEAGPGLLDSHDPERRSFAEELVEQQYAAMTERTAPHRRDDTVAAQVDPATFLFGFRYLEGAFRPPGAGLRYENPGAPSGSPGSRVPLLPPAVDPRGYDLTLLTAAPQWARQGRRAAGQAGITVDIRLVADSGDAAGWTDTVSIGTQGAVLVRPDRYVAWRSAAPPGAAGFRQALRAIFCDGLRQPHICRSSPPVINATRRAQPA
jgi:2-polyprenyl-6-methoxyphenol hydroxylase-like FAD-dependent oxidoreductase